MRNFYSKFQGQMLTVKQRFGVVTKEYLTSHMYFLGIMAQTFRQVCVNRENTTDKW